MFTIWSIASSCPMIILRRFDSSDIASRPVFAGSNGMLSRTILSSALSRTIHPALRNPSAAAVTRHYCFAKNLDAVRLVRAPNLRRLRNPLEIRDSEIANTVHYDHHFVARSKAEGVLRTRPPLRGVRVENHTSPDLQPHVEREPICFSEYRDRRGK